MDTSGQGQGTTSSKHKEEVRERKDDKETVNRFSRTDHEGLKAQIHFVLLKHDLNFPAMRIVHKNVLVCKRKRGADKGTQCLLIAKGVLGIGEQNNRFLYAV